eukprot:TRINITY_DN311_c0_g1_i1.p1 TRINITY_DN311_c0_g1~~TRINITY_DN311_c0_g1_i1.p1  ORF type:complete len:208 (-),score=33.05 TRINITY_DN311_c0_g1_i1:51-674(-)
MKGLVVCIFVFIASLCLAHGAEAVPLALQQQPTNNNTDVCALCEMMARWVEAYLIENATEQAIIKNMEVVCAIAPQPYDNDCSAFVALELPFVIRHLENKYTPSKACQMVDVCQSTAGGRKSFGLLRSLFSAPPKTECNLCKTVVGIAQTYEEWGFTKEQIIPFLDSACDSIGQYAAQCKAHVTMILALVMDNTKTDIQICRSVSLC